MTCDPTIDVQDCPAIPTFGGDWWTDWTPEQHMATLRHAIEHLGVDGYRVALEVTVAHWESCPEPPRSAMLATLERYYSLHI